MASLFEGTPQAASSYVTSTTEMPKWLQDAIYNQIQWSQNLANKPYEAYSAPTVAEFNPMQTQAYNQVSANQGSWQPAMQAAQSGMQGVAASNTASGLQTAQNQYLNPSSAANSLQQGQNLYGQASGMSITGAANPYMQSAGQSSVQNINSYMNPYQQNVLDTIAKQGARNLSENILPGVSDAFIKSGQFGSSRMGEMGSRAIRDTQEAILNAQSTAAQQGYAQALGASQADLARQQQLASTAGQLTSQQQQNLANLGQLQTAAGQVQQQYGLNAAQANQAAQASDYVRQLSALQNLATNAQQQQQMGYTDTAALEAAGLSQQALQQKKLDVAKAQYDAEQLYPRQQMDWLSTITRGLAPITPQSTSQSTNTTGQTYSASPLSQLATGLSATAGLSKLIG